MNKSVDEVNNKNVDSFEVSYNKHLSNYYDLVEQQEEEEEELREQFRKEHITKKTLDYKLEVLEVKEDMAKKEAIEGLDKAVERFKGAYKDSSKISGGNLDQEDVALLNSGINLTREELQAMANKHNRTGNDTMKRLIRQYGEDKKIGVMVEESNYHANLIDQLMEGVKKGLEGESRAMRNYVANPEYRQELFSSFKSGVVRESK